MSQPEPALEPSDMATPERTVFSRCLRHLRQGPWRLGWRIMPGELKVMWWFSAIIILVLSLGLVMPGATFDLDGYDAARDEYLVKEGPLLALLVIELAVLMYGIWTERRWVRGMAVLFALATLACHAWSSSFHLSILVWISWAAGILGEVWFWYEKDDIVEYYERLELAAFEQPKA